MKIMVAIVLAVILALLLLNRAIKGSKSVDIVAVAENAMPLLADFNQDVQQALAVAATASTGAPASKWANRANRVKGQPLPRDPFQFQLPAEVRAAALAQSLAAELSGATLEAESAGLRLQATMIDGYGRLALINDEMVGEGDTVWDYTVQRIRSGHVVLSQGAEVVHLRLEDEGTP